MAVSSTANRATYAGNGSSTSFSFPYYFVALADLKVIVTDALGVETPQLLATNYTISGTPVNGVYVNGANVVFLVAPVAGTTITIYRDPAQTQALRLTENEPKPSNLIEQELDLLTLLDQRLADRVSRAVRFSEGFATVFDPTLPSTIGAIDGTLTIDSVAKKFGVGPSGSSIGTSVTAAAASAAAAASSASSASASAAATATGIAAAAASATAAATSATAAAASQAAAFSSQTAASASAAAAAASAATAGGGVLTTPLTGFLPAVGVITSADTFLSAMGKLAGNDALNLSLTGGNLTGPVDMGFNKITSLTDPTGSQDAASKNYVDMVASAMQPILASYAASTANIPATYNNGVAGVGATLTVTATGAFTIDGVSPPLNARILIKNQTTGLQNGVYNLTTVGSSGVSPVLTRSADWNTPASINAGDLIPVIFGTTNVTTSWLQTATVTTVGTDTPVFVAWTANPSSYLKVATNLSDVASKAAAFNNLHPMTTTGDLIGYVGGTGAVRVPIGSDGQVPVADSTQSNGLKWATLQQGAKNYITYNNFENNATTGWSLAHTALSSLFPTSTAAANTAFDSSHGGSAANGNLSFFTTSAAAKTLAGSVSGLLQSSAASTAGDMLISQAYSLDQEDQAKVLSFKAYYKITSNPGNGNFSGTSSNTWAVYIYDVTNAAWIQPAGVYNIVQSAGVGILQGTFQTPSNMTKFQIALVNINASAGAIELAIDDVYVGPQALAFGPAVQDTQAYTPTFVGLGSPPTNISAFWWRVGERLHVWGKCSAGATTGVAATISLPSGLSIDTSKCTSAGTNQFGTLWRGPATPTQIPAAGVAPMAITDNFGVNQTTVAISAHTSASSGFVIDNGSTVANTSDFLEYRFSVPIVGWSSNTQMSADTDTRVIACSAYLSGSNQTGVNPNNSDSLIALNSIVLSNGVGGDTAGSFNTGTSLYSVPVTGWYTISGVVNMAGTNILNSLYSASIHVAGNPSVYGAAITPGAGAAVIVGVTATLYLTAGQTVGLYLYGAGNNSSSTLTCVKGASNTFLSIARCSGPAVVAASESVNAKYNTSTQTVTGAQLPLACTVKEFDSHNAYNTSTGLYTVPVSGTYRVSGAAIGSVVTTTGTNSTVIEIDLFKNGSGVCFMNSMVSQVNSLSVNPSAFGASIVKALAGDTLSVSLIRGITNSYTLTGSSQQQWVSFERIGN